MSGIALPIDAVSGAPAFPAAQHRVAQAALIGAGNGRVLGARSGIRPGAEPTVTTTSTTWTATPFNGVCDPMTGGTVGPYLFAFVANETGSISAADNSQTIVDRLDVQVPDDPPGASPRTSLVVHTPGVAGAGAPAAPARSTPIGTITIPKVGGGPPVFAATWAHAVAAGGIVPTLGTSDYPSTPYVGQYIDDPTAGLLRWNGTGWNQYVKLADTGWVNLTVGASWVSAGAQYRVINGIVYMRGQIQTTSGNFAISSAITLISAGGMPAITRPAVDNNNFVVSGSSFLASMRGIVYTTGQMQIATGTTTGAYVDLAGFSGYPNS